MEVPVLCSVHEAFKLDPQKFLCSLLGVCCFSGVSGSGVLVSVFPRGALPWGTTDEAAALSHVPGHSGPCVAAVTLLRHRMHWAQKPLMAQDAASAQLFLVR